MERRRSLVVLLSLTSFQREEEIEYDSKRVLYHFADGIPAIERFVVKFSLDVMIAGCYK